MKNSANKSNLLSRGLYKKLIFFAQKLFLFEKEKTFQSLSVKISAQKESWTAIPPLNFSLRLSMFSILVE